LPGAIRGELIHLQLALARLSVDDERFPALLRAQDRLLAEHETRWIPQRSIVRIRRGFVTHVMARHQRRTLQHLAGTPFESMHMTELEPPEPRYVPSTLRALEGSIPRAFLDEMLPRIERIGLQSHELEGTLFLPPNIQDLDISVWNVLARHQLAQMRRVARLRVRLGILEVPVETITEMPNLVELHLISTRRGTVEVPRLERLSLNGPVLPSRPPRALAIRFQEAEMIDRLAEWPGLDEVERLQLHADAPGVRPRPWPWRRRLRELTLATPVPEAFVDLAAGVPLLDLRACRGDGWAELLHDRVLVAAVPELQIWSAARLRRLPRLVRVIQYVQPIPASPGSRPGSISPRGWRPSRRRTSSRGPSGSRGAASAAP
jgi:hypothetical protein